MESSEVRVRLTERLIADILGPKESDETLPAGRNPRDEYLTGILYPQQSKIDVYEAEVAVEEGPGSDLGESSLADEVRIGRAWLPSSMGLSFLVTAPNECAGLAISVEVGKYSYVEAEPKSESEWVRESLNSGGVPVRLTDGKLEYPESLEEYGLNGLRLFIRKSVANGQAQFTVCIVNSHEDDGTLDFQARNERCFFQCQMKISTTGETEFLPRRSPYAGTEKDQKLNGLLYRDTHEFATGHTCSATWDEDASEPQWIATTWVPVQKVDDVDPDGDPLLQKKLTAIGRSGYSAEDIYSFSDSDLIELLRTLPSTYGDWLKEEAHGRASSLSDELKSVVEVQLSETKAVIDRMNGSIKCLEINKSAMQAFRLANRAMTRQAGWQGYPLIWRPFQLGFALLTLESLVSRNRDRDIMDLLWFPTGGGKTEAYLLLMAFILFYRRLEKGSLLAEDGVAVITRYTLRALTTDQFERTVAMISACELVRREAESGAKNTKPFSLGLWIGSGSTPNKYEDAKKSLDGGQGATPRVIESCPVCKSTLSWSADDVREEINCQCNTSDCEIGVSFGRLPIHTVDEQIYRHHPSIVIGTVDKFAQVCRFPTRTDGLFNRGTDYKPPDLIVQDELHLISGPLGTTTGLMELAIDSLCSGADYQPKIIGSTATIQRASEQVGALFDRSVCQFPTPVINADNSFFARRKTESTGRHYVGITTAGRTPTFMLQAICGSMLQAINDSLFDGEADAIDPYTTLAAYFNSLRILGGARTLLWEDAQKSKGVFASIRGEEPRKVEDLQELTSAVSQEELKQTLARLKLDRSDDGHVDMLLASVMLSVGVNIPRLGLMVVDGQPKTMAEYIQATSRVGRGEIPGLIITLYNNSKARDRSHYETFKTWHSAFYRHVEATSATPFASRARDKGLKALIVALAARLTDIQEDDATLTPDRRRVIEEKVKPLILKRVSNIDAAEQDNCESDIDQFLDDWEAKGKLSYLWNDFKPSESLFVSAERAAQGKAIGQAVTTWAAPNSMRDVEPDVSIQVHGRI